MFPQFLETNILHGEQRTFSFSCQDFAKPREGHQYDVRYSCSKIPDELFYYKFDFQYMSEVLIRMQEYTQSPNLNKQNKHK